MKKQKTINIKKIYNLETSFTTRGFVLQFHNESYKVRLHFDLWWITYIARDLWKIINRKKTELVEIERNMKEQPQ
jgi:hypothetical protein